MQCGFWNLNGFNCNKDSEKYYLLSTCIRHLNLDILCVAETHLTGNNVIDIDGFSWFGQNREIYILEPKTDLEELVFWLKRSC